MWLFLDDSRRVPCECQERIYGINLRQQAQERAALPVSYRECRFSTFDPTWQKAAVVAGNLREAVFHWVSGKGAPLLMVVSVVGTGKTHLGASAINWCIERNIPAYYLTASEFAKRLRDFEAAAEASPEDFLQRMSEMDVLVMDDVGVEYTSDYLRTRYHDLIDERYLRKARTLLISNLGASDLEARLGRRAIDRFRERGTGRILVFEDESDPDGIASVRGRMAAWTTASNS